MLTSKQRSYLRKLANSQDAIFQIGKGGIGPNMVKQVNEALEARELVKVHVLENSELSTREACDILAAETGAEGVQVVGSKFVIYKKSRENPRIQLP
ncbi:MAG TPA: YhbY family RNA-binding protein [Clostridiales bacterium]|nr:YhbY family RNA-binding protein [Clostridiales bacterium]